MSGIKSHNVILDRRSYAKGEIILREGDVGNVAYIVQHGKLSVFSEKKGKKIELSKLGAGDIFGELALILDMPRSASVEVIEDCNLIVIRRDDFEKKLSKSDTTLKAVIEMLTRRLIHANIEVVKTKGVNVDHFILLLNQLFRDLLEAMPDSDKEMFKAEAFPIMNDMVKVLEKYRDKL